MTECERYREKIVVNYSSIAQTKVYSAARQK